MPEVTAALSEKLREVRQFCEKHLSELETWPGYYHRRYLEFLSYYELLPQDRYEHVLELGCGNGYQSAMLAQIAGTVTATDLPSQSYETHTPGMKKAMDLHKQLGISNVVLQACSAEQLPFPDGSFDLVYASHVLEHIPDRDKALSEICRVLKPGGTFLCIVPTSFEKVYGFLNHYSYLIRRSFHHLSRMVVPKKKPVATAVTKPATAATPELGNSIKVQFSHFPFPPPHGHSDSYLQEMREWTPRKWRKYVVSHSAFTCLQQSTSQFNPLLPLFGGIAPTFAFGAHAFSRSFERRTGKSRFFQAIGVNTVLIFVAP